MSEAAVVSEGLVKVYRSATGETHALRGIDLEVPRGAMTVIAGPSGSGKSSLLHLLAVRDRPSAGRLLVLGTDTVEVSARELRILRRRQVGFVAQRASTALFPHLTTEEHLRQVAALRSASDVDVHSSLEIVDLVQRASHRPAESSGGEQQRLAVAMALVGGPELVVADEPTAELDTENASRVLSALRGAAAAGSAVVVSSHDDRVVARADRVLRLRHGVLSSETARTGHTVAVIDSSGRLQLPPEALQRFPNDRAEVQIREDGVFLRSPREPG